MNQAAAERAAEQAARSAYGQLLAWLAAGTRDIDAAEDALSEAFEAALRTWPERGVPKQPEAWLLTTARRRIIGRHRRAEVAERALPSLQVIADEAAARVSPTGGFPDKRLELLFVCAHPAIAAPVRAPLMLQTVLGLDAARMASAFLVAPATLGQRLVRAKRKIRAAGIAFRVPGPTELPDRLDAVLEAVYAAYGTGYDHLDGTDAARAGLAAEAIDLATLLVDFLSDEAEARALLALMTYSDARRSARRGSDGTFVALADQDTDRWDHEAIARADQHMAALRHNRRIGHFQLEAAIQQIHCRRAITGATDWSSIRSLYDALLTVAPTLGAAVAAAAASLEADGPEVALARLDDLATQANTYQPWWAVRAHALARSGDPAAAAAFRTAAGMTEDQAVRNHLLALAET